MKGKARDAGEALMGYTSRLSSQAAQISLARSPLLHPPLRRTSERRDGVALLTFRSKLPRDGAMATEKATPGAPTTCWGQTPVRGFACTRAT
jgi:hypothetical protein